MFFEREGRTWSVDDLLAALGNRHDREILAIAQQRPVDAHEIMEATGFPKSTVYRRLRELEETGMIVPSSGVVRKGHAVGRYRATIGCVRITLVRGELEVRWRAPPSPDAPPTRRGSKLPPPIGLAERVAAPAIEQLGDPDA